MYVKALVSTLIFWAIYNEFNCGITLQMFPLGMHECVCMYVYMYMLVLTPEDVT